MTGVVFARQRDRLPKGEDEPESFYTSDPGKALITGQCSDFNRIKGPILREIAARARYFHNGTAASLRELVNFYDQRFSMQLTDEQKSQRSRSSTHSRVTCCTAMAASADAAIVSGSEVR